MYPKSYARTLALAVLAVVTLSVAPLPSQAQLTGNCSSPTTSTLWAGQTINVGTLSVCNDQNYLYVTYSLTYPGATFGTLHLWVGSDLANVPSNSQGVPVPGQFPFNFDANGATTYTFQIPLSSINIADVTDACGFNIYVVSHAEVSMSSGTETAFGGNTGINVGSPGRWWYYATYAISCDQGQVDTACMETAFAKGNYIWTTDKKSNPENLPSLKLTRNRWGWAIQLPGPGLYSYDIWAGAGLNNTNNGTKVGTLDVNWTGNSATVTYSTTAPYLLEEVHLYASNSAPSTIAPGRFGNTAYPDGTQSYTFTVALDPAQPAWLIAHAVVSGFACELP